jgi:hypothetical protein
MPDPYYIDLEAFSLARFRDELETREVLPGRRILKEDIAGRFAVLESMGIENLAELVQALKTKKKVEAFAQQSGLSQDYLTILRREVNRYLPNPVNLAKFPGVEPAYVEKLASVGIKHSKHLFDRGRTRDARDDVSRQAAVPGDAVLELVKLSDLVRVSGVGPVFARILYQAGSDTLEKLATSSPEGLHDRVMAVNLEMGYTNAAIPMRDIAYCIEVSQELPKAIKY